MKIALVSDSMTHPTGFGRQAKLMAYGLYDRGHEVLNISPLGTPWENQDFEKGPVEWGIDYFFDAKVAVEMLREYRPDVVLCFRDAAFLAPFNKFPDLFANCKVFFWYADENEGASREVIAKTAVFMPGSVLPVSHSAANCVDPKAVREVLHHAISPEYLKTHGSKTDLRNKWTQNLGVMLRSDDIIIFCGERNDFRKNWDATYNVVSRLVDNVDENVVLLEVTSEHDQVMSYNRPLCREFYGLEGRCIDVRGKVRHITDSDMAELLSISNLRISCSGAEGFGLLTLEAAALGIPQVVNEVKSYHEIILDSPSIVPYQRRSLFPQNVMYFNNKVHTVPDVDAMVERCLMALKDDQFLLNMVDHNKRAVIDRFTVKSMVDQFLRIVEDSPIPCSKPRESTVANINTVRALSYIFKHLVPGGTVLELGCSDGMLIGDCHSRSLNPLGVTFERNVTSERFGSRSLKRVSSFYDGGELPKADILVAPDTISEFLNLCSVDDRLSAMTLLSNDYEFIFIRNLPSMNWDIPHVDDDVIESLCTSAGLHRRTDLESIVASAKKVSLNGYSIWSKSRDGTIKNVQEFWRGAA